MTIRIPIASDAGAIARVQVDAWRETYSRLLPARFFDAATFERLQGMWTRMLSNDSPPRTIRVAETGGQIVGFGAAWEPPDRASDNGHRGPGVLELGMLYLLAGSHGSGLGQDLLDAVIEDRPACLWMAQDNPRASAFYRRNRFAPTGEYRLEESFDNLPEIRLAR